MHSRFNGFSLLSVSVNLLREWVISPLPNPQLGGAGDHFSSGPYLLGMDGPIPADIALRVIGTRNPHHHCKVMIPAVRKTGAILKSS